MEESTEKAWFCGLTDCQHNLHEKGEYGSCRKYTFLTKCWKQEAYRKIHGKRRIKLLPVKLKEEELWNFIKPIPKLIPKYSDSSYFFQGPINFSHLCNDCRTSKKFSFLALSENLLYFGFSRQVPETLVQKYKKDFLAARIHDTYLPFHVFSCKKNYTTLLMDRLKDIEKEVKRANRKVAKKLHKDKVEGKFSNKISTKVMVF